MKLPVRVSVRWQGVACIDKGAARQAWSADGIGVKSQTQLVVGEKQGSERWERPAELPTGAFLPLLARRRWPRLRSIAVKAAQGESCFGHCGWPVAG